MPETITPAFSGGSLGIHRPPLERSDRCDIHGHGEFVSKCFIGDTWTLCPVCAGMEHQKSKEAIEQQERDAKRSRWATKLGDAGIPERFRAKTLDSFSVENEGQARVLAFATEYAEGFESVMETGRSAVFLGNPGTGKNHLALAIGLRVMGKFNRSVLFTTVMRLIRRVRDTWHRDSKESHSAAVDTFVFPDLLILDEVGVQFGSEAEQIILFDILNERYGKRRPTILISNLPVDDYASPDGKTHPGLRSYLGERVYDRLREDGGSVLVFDWDSWRGRAGG